MDGPPLVRKLSVFMPRHACTLGRRPAEMVRRSIKAHWALWAQMKKISRPRGIPDRRRGRGTSGGLRDAVVSIGRKKLPKQVLHLRRNQRDGRQVRPFLNIHPGSQTTPARTVRLKLPLGAFKPRGDWSVQHSLSVCGNRYLALALPGRYGGLTRAPHLTPGARGASPRAAPLGCSQKETPKCAHYMQLIST